MRIGALDIGDMVVGDDLRGYFRVSEVWPVRKLGREYFVGLDDNGGFEIFSANKGYLISWRQPPTDGFYLPDRTIFTKEEIHRMWDYCLSSRNSFRRLKAAKDFMDVIGA